MEKYLVVVGIIVLVAVVGYVTYWVGLYVSDPKKEPCREHYYMRYTHGDPCTKCGYGTKPPKGI